MNPRLKRRRGSSTGCDAVKDPREETHADPEFSRLVHSEMEKLSERKRSRRGAWIAAGALLLAGGGGAAWLASQSAPRETGNAKPTDALRKALAAENYPEARLLLADGTWKETPAALKRWERAARAFEEETRARDLGQWEGALDALEKALEAAAKDTWVTEEVQRRRALVAAEAKAAQAIARARALWGAGDGEAALVALESVPAESVYRREADHLRASCTDARDPALAQVPPPAEAPPQETQAPAMVLYDAGEAGQALAMIPSQDPSAARIREVHDLYEKGLRAMTDGELVEAARHLRTLLARETNLRNWYAARAAQGLSEIREATRDLTASWAEEARKLADQGSYEESLVLVNQLRDVDPDDPRAAEVLGFLRGARERLYQEGYILLDLDPVKARKRWLFLLALLPEEDPLREKIRARLPPE